MDGVRICPRCGAENDAKLFACQHCGASIFRAQVQPAPGSQAPHAAFPDPGAVPDQTQPVQATPTPSPAPAQQPPVPSAAAASPPALQSPPPAVVAPGAAPAAGPAPVVVGSPVAARKAQQGAVWTGAKRPVRRVYPARPAPRTVPPPPPTPRLACPRCGVAMELGEARLGNSAWQKLMLGISWLELFFRAGGVGRHDSILRPLEERTAARCGTCGGLWLDPA